MKHENSVITNRCTLMRSNESRTEYYLQNGNRRLHYSLCNRNFRKRVSDLHYTGTFTRFEVSPESPTRWPANTRLRQPSNVEGQTLVRRTVSEKK